MKRSIRMFFLAILIGALFIAVIMTFMALGIAHPVPWVLLVTMIAIPLVFNLSERSQYVKWDDKYSVGIESIDDDHRKLFHLINQFETAIRYHTGETFEKQALNDLLDYTRYHFDREEKMLEENGYADIAAHKDEHQKMIAKVDEFFNDYKERGHAALEEAPGFLRDWLINHINGTDQAYSEFMQGKDVH